MRRRVHGGIVARAFVMVKSTKGTKALRGCIIYTRTAWSMGDPIPTRPAVGVDEAAIRPANPMPGYCYAYKTTYYTCRQGDVVP